MKVDVTKSYLDLSRAVIDTAIHGRPGETDTSDAIFSLLSCTYVYSYSALVSFCSSHLYEIWTTENNELKTQYPECTNFEELMAGPLKEIKKAIKTLATLKGIDPIHVSEPNLWRQLNELLKGYRDYFIHPNPEFFHEHLEATGNIEWQFASSVASGIIGYFYNACTGDVPVWVTNTSLHSRGFEVVGI